MYQTWWTMIGSAKWKERERERESFPICLPRSFGRFWRDIIYLQTIHTLIATSGREKLNRSLHAQRVESATVGARAPSHVQTSENWIISQMLKHFRMSPHSYFNIRARVRDANASTLLWFTIRGVMKKSEVTRSVGVAMQMLDLFFLVLLWFRRTPQ